LDPPAQLKQNTFPVYSPSAAKVTQPLQGMLSLDPKKGQQHPFSLRFKDADLERRFTEKTFATKSFVPIQLGQAIWACGWAISYVYCKPIDPRFHLFMTSVAFLVFFLGLIPAATSSATRSNHFAVVNWSVGYLQTLVITVTRASGEVARMRHETRALDAMTQDYMMSLVASNEIRWLALLFLVVQVNIIIIQTPHVSFSFNAMISLFGWGCFVVSVWLVTEIYTSSKQSLGDETEIVPLFDGPDYIVEESRKMCMIVVSSTAVMLWYKSQAMEQDRRESFLLVCESQQLQQQLLVEKEEKAKAEASMNSWVCHEVRNPLNGVVGFAELIVQQCEHELGSAGVDVSPWKKVRQMTRNILKASSFMTSVLNNMLDLAKIDSGKMALKAEPVHLGEIISDLYELLSPMRAPGVKLKKGVVFISVAGQQIDEHAAEYAQYLKRYAVISGDGVRWKQVLLNLLANAVRFTANGFLHTLFVFDLQKKRLFVKVMDTGPGIDPTATERLFQKYEQLNVHAVHPQGGGGSSGLGLVVAQRIAALW
jgi:signal transduction histidine kinase